MITVLKGNMVTQQHGGFWALVFLAVLCLALYTVNGWLVGAGIVHADSIGQALYGFTSAAFGAALGTMNPGGKQQDPPADPPAPMAPKG